MILFAIASIMAKVSKVEILTLVKVKELTSSSVLLYLVELYKEFF